MALYYLHSQSEEKEEEEEDEEEEEEDEEEEEAWASFQWSERSLFETVPVASLGHQGLKKRVGQDIRSSVCIQEANALNCLHS